MLRFHAQSFVASSATITQIVQILSSGGGLQDSHYKEMGISLGEMMRECERVDLPMTLAQLKRIKESLDGVVGSRGEKTITNDSIRQMFHELMNRLWDELDTHVFITRSNPRNLYSTRNPKDISGRKYRRLFLRLLANLRMLQSATPLVGIPLACSI